MRGAPDGVPALYWIEDADLIDRRRETMATVTVRDTQHSMTDAGEIRAFLQPFGIWYRRFEGSDQLSETAEDQEILAAYDEPIRELMAEGGYVTADVINIRPDVPNLDTMLNRFNKEHWHDEDEVRFIVHGRGLFHIHPKDGPVFSIEVVKGDMIKVPLGTHHWFDLCQDRTIRAIRLFQDVSGWTPQYTGSGTDANYQPLCFGPMYIPARGV
jgi:1,2-dihydroxy-3-keto-5-methylthiopentene dioxygenase